MTGRAREQQRSSEREQELRCPCGRLLARSKPQGIELKCPRCKRSVVLSWQALANGPVLVELSDDL